MLKVLDFYASGKICPNRYNQVLMNDVLFCIMIELNGKVKELATTVTKRYHYECAMQPEDFVLKKVHEYNILSDFLVAAKDRIKDKWNLSEGDYQDLLMGLELCLVSKYSDCGWLKKLFLVGKGNMKKFVNTIGRRLGPC